MYKKISIAYWKPNKEDEKITGYPHNCDFVYSIETQRQISETALDKGFNVMLRRMPIANTDEIFLLILLDRGRFTQS